MLGSELNTNEIMNNLKFRVWDSISECLHPWSMICNNKFSDFSLDHYTLEQFIGLKDMRGNNIYVGDVLSCDDASVVIEFIGGQFVGINTDKDHPIVETQNRNWFQWVITSNIHQNETTK